MPRSLRRATVDNRGIGIAPRQPAAPDGGTKLLVSMTLVKAERGTRCFVRFPIFRLSLTALLDLIRAPSGSTRQSRHAGGFGARGCARNGLLAQSARASPR
jgi:hypothetical protein